MKKSIQNRGKLNNAGMSLVEIIVAIAILSVAIIPLLYAFVNSTIYNGKGRELQQTTVLAHTIIENCKAYSAEEIEEQMANHTFIDNVTSWDKVGSVDTDVTYFMTGVRLENQLYDVSLKLSPHMAGGITSNVPMMYSESMNPYLDAVFTADSSQSIETEGGAPYTAANLDETAYTLALQKIQQDIKDVIAAYPGLHIPAGYEVSFADIEDDVDTYGFKLCRYITISTYKDAAGNEKAVVSYEYKYYVTSGKFDYIAVTSDSLGGIWTTTLTSTQPSTEATAESVATYNFEIYNNENTKSAVASPPVQLENVYVFYYPAYSGSSSNCKIEKDSIKIENSLNRAVDFYLVKQKDPDYNDTILNIVENSYAPVINGNSVLYVNLYHNYNTNLSGQTSVVGTPTIIGAKVLDPSLPDTMILTKTWELMFDVEVSIYKNGSYDSSTHSMKPDADLVLTMDGSALNW